jgi:hypothetical protein
MQKIPFNEKGNIYDLALPRPADFGIFPDIARNEPYPTDYPRSFSLFFALPRYLRKCLSKKLHNVKFFSPSKAARYGLCQSTRCFPLNKFFSPTVCPQQSQLTEKTSYFIVFFWYVDC